MKESIIKILKNEIHKRFKEHPYDFTSYEIEAQCLLVQKIRERITGFGLVQLDYSIPKIKNEKTTRVKLEWPLSDGKHDIVVFKEGTVFGKDRVIPYEEVDCFIEIKCGWGDSPDAHFYEGVFKDLEAIKKHPEKGILINFIANNFSDLSEESKKKYEDRFNEVKKEYGILPGSISMLYVFRDKILE